MYGLVTACEVCLVLINIVTIIVCVCVRACLDAHACGGQRKTLGIVILGSLFYGGPRDWAQVLMFARLARH